MTRGLTPTEKLGWDDGGVGVGDGGDVAVWTAELRSRRAGASAADGLRQRRYPLRAAVDRDKAVFQRERQGRPVSALPLLQGGQPPPPPPPPTGAGCGGDSGRAGPSFFC